MSEPTGSTRILTLPSAPVFMSIMRTIEGKPEGIPIWNSFDNRTDISLQNESITSTLISLSKNITDIAEGTGDGKVMSVSVDKKTYNIYTPAKNSNFQVSFIVVFEEETSVLVTKENRQELVRAVVKTLSNSDELRNYLSKSGMPQIAKGEAMYDTILHMVASEIMDWDKKRVKYIEKQQRKEAERLRKLAEAEMQAEMNAAKPQEKD